VPTIPLFGPMGYGRFLIHSGTSGKRGDRPERGSGPDPLWLVGRAENDSTYR
jgi:hypothetical protein